MSVIEKWITVDCPGCGAPARARVLHIVAWGSIPGAQIPHRVSILCPHHCSITRDRAASAVPVCPECRLHVA